MKIHGTGKIFTSHPFTLKMQDKTGLCKAANPLPNRAKRLEASTKEVENLYYRHAAQDKSLKTPLSAPSQDNISGSTQRTQNAPKEQEYGIPLSQQVVEGQVPQSSNRGNPQVPRPSSGLWRDGAIDARSFAARAQQKPSDRASTTDRSGSVDARNLGARPPDSQTTDGGRSSEVYDRLPRRHTFGLEQKQRFPFRQNSQGLQGEGLQRRPPSTANSYQNEQAIPRERRDESSFRSRNPASEESTLTRSFRSAGQDRRVNPGVQTERPPRAGATRTGENRKPKKPKRNRQAQGTRSTTDRRNVEVSWTEAEQAYLDAKRDREAQKSVAYKPSNFSENAFTGLRPAVVSGENGMNELLSEKLTMARKHLNGEFIQWDSREQKADVMTLVERLKGIDQDSPSDQTVEKSSSPSTEAEKQTQSLLQKLLGGQYAFTKPLESKDIIGHVARHVDKNESYFPEDQTSLLEKVKSLVLQDQARKGTKSARPAERA
ncbi:hypothetical protein ACLMJK_006952 [Lecanora helva]